MPSIEISLSNDSRCPVAGAGHHHRRNISGDRGASASTIMMLHEDQLLSVEDNLAAMVSKNMPFGGDDEDDYHPYHDIIEIHDDYTTASEGNNGGVTADDSSIVLGRLPMPSHSGPATSGCHPQGGVVSKFRHMIQENFASRASMSLEAETSSRSRKLPEVHFLEHRV